MRRVDKTIPLPADVRLHELSRVWVCRSGNWVAWIPRGVAWVEEWYSVTGPLLGLRFIFPTPLHPFTAPVPPFSAGGVLWAQKLAQSSAP